MRLAYLRVVCRDSRNELIVNFYRICFSNINSVIIVFSATGCNSFVGRAKLHIFVKVAGAHRILNRANFMN